MKVLNLESGGYSVAHAIVMVEIEIENSKREGAVAIKVVHGYGSHGVGGAISIELKNQLALWKKKGFIKNYFSGNKWNLFDENSRKILEKDKTIFGDRDLYTSNPGITIIEV